MSSANVLTPTAPELYPQLQPDFRMQKINEISAALSGEVSHYRAVGKKYKRAKKYCELERCVFEWAFSSIFKH